MKTLLPILLALSACATPSHPTPASGASSAAAPSPGLAQTAAPATPQESLLAYVPDNAIGVLVLRRHTLAALRSLGEDNRELHAELSQFLGRSLGVDLTQIEGLVVFSVSDGKTPSGGVLLRLPGSAGGGLQLPPAGEIDGVPTYKLDGEVLAARVPAGIILGTPRELRAEIALAQNKARPLSPDAPLALALGREIDEIDFAAALGGKALDAAAQFGASQASLLYRRGGRLVLTVSGDATKLQASQALLLQTINVALVNLEEQKAKAVRSNHPLEGSAAIIAYHSARKLSRELTPKLVGNQLIIDYQLPGQSSSAAMMMPMTVGLVGVLAAVAIPAFMKYTRRSKSVEATMNVRKLWDSTVVYREDHAADGKKFAFPPSTEWTPARGCCGQPGDKCAPDPKDWSGKTWQALKFAIDDPHYYQYRFVSKGKGPQATFSIEARGDLDCNGKFSLFQRTGAILPDGSVSGGAGLFTQDEIE